MFNNFFLFDSSTAWQISFQDPATPVMEGIINLHHDLMFFITFIFFFVLIVMVRTLYYFTGVVSNTSNNSYSRHIVHGTAIEIIWTVLPSLILVVVALPSFALLYSIDEIIEPSLTIKCVGHQWYW
jgi:cytochrome c oxidase subunit 2